MSCIVRVPLTLPVVVNFERYNIIWINNIEPLSNIDSCFTIGPGRD